MKNINYEKFEISKYLTSPLFSRNSRCLLFSLRTRTLRGIKCDFPGIYTDKMCPVGCGYCDTIPHILTCTSIIKQYHRSGDISVGQLHYEDIFSNDVRKQKQVVELYENLIEIRNRLVNSLPVACTGPLQSMSTLQNHPVVV